MVVPKFAFPFEETFVMHDAPSRLVEFVGHKSVQHFVIHNVFQIPPRHEFAIEQRMDPNDAITLLNTAKYDVAGRTPATPASPRNGVTAKPIAEIPRVNAFEDRAQIEVSTIRTEFELSLHCTLRRQRVPFARVFCYRFGRWFPLSGFVCALGHDPKFWAQT
jgi:hypothetical protein